MKKRMRVLMCALATMGITTLSTPVMFAQNVAAPAAVEGTTIQPRDYIYEWYYKVIDGHLYKRLFNATTGHWEGDWILVQ